ncbi:low specificity L-threonine aldolase [Shimia thalassica]|uniref:threonine aldolase family protein n=1 Tax=Shimia thalassica TaxID=1715693 RepID=UPI001C0A5DE0|nr:low specificity L-threonine aldolase [Shimia thalassica]MBU2942766.1 low specificity L-threonine aldolase [Shimia thalassica]MDO6502466.1 low specificity L-threonine aldolase [Shimia thalassica]
MFFASDNAGPAHPSVLTALADANQGYAMPYGADPIMDEVRTKIRDIFEAPNAEVFLVATGTAANSLALACYCQPWQTMFCAPVAHIQEDECNAPEFFAGGAKLTLVGEGEKMTPTALEQSIRREETRGVHGPQRGPVSITQVTERGTVYSLEELNALTKVAKSFDLPVHLDGARFANALVALDCSPADMTWKAGVDVVSFGGTKNGCVGVEAVIFFDPDKAWEFELRRKRGAHLFSKHRYLSAQMNAYLTDDVWRQNAQQANANCARLAKGLRDLGVKFMHDPQANIVFCSFPRAAHQRLHDAGAVYYVWSGELEGDDPAEMLEARLVCDWSLSNEQIDQFISLIGAD